MIKIYLVRINDTLNYITIVLVISGVTVMGVAFTYNQDESLGFSLLLCSGIIVESFPLSWAV